MKYISLDLETTGIDPENDQILEIGAIIEDSEKRLPLEECPKFHFIVEQESGRYSGTPFALSLNQRIFDVLKGIPEHGGLPDKHCPAFKYRAENRVIKSDTVSSQFYFWLRENDMQHDRIVFAGKNFGPFDLQFLKKLKNWNQMVKHSSRILDPGLMYTNFKTDKVPPNMTECKKRAGIKNTVVSHHALEDAWDVIELLRKKY